MCLMLTLIDILKRPSDRLDNVINQSVASSLHGKHNMRTILVRAMIFPWLSFGCKCRGTDVKASFKSMESVLLVLLSVTVTSEHRPNDCDLFQFLNRISSKNGFSK